jgi:hypothetical protein
MSLIIKMVDAAKRIKETKMKFTDNNTVKVGRKLRVGAVNWDCSLSSDTYFGSFQTRTLSPEKYRRWTPYYAEILEKNKIEYPIRRQEEYDRELQLAIDAGIDYFAFVFYPEKAAEACDGETTWEDRVYELNYARKLYESSSLKDKIGMAAIIGASRHYERDYIELAEAFKQPYYEKIDGRPILYLFSNEFEFVDGVRRAVEKVGGEMPLFIAMDAKTLNNEELLGNVDGLSAYACGASDIVRYYECVDEAIKGSELRASAGKMSVPLFPMGWNPSPRIDIPSPWVSYRDTKYAPPATAEELLEGGKRFGEWLRTKKTSSCNITNHVLIFAWNEFEEGAWICPTYNEDLSVNTERVGAVSQIISHWKSIFYN